MSVADGRRDGYCKEETVDEAPVDVLALFTKTVDQIVILRHQKFVNHQMYVWLAYLTVIQLFDMFWKENISVSGWVKLYEE